MKTEQLKDLLLSSIFPDPQARTEFNEAELQELAASMQLRGLLNRIVVRPRPGGKNGQYQIVCGERRWRAAGLNGWDSIACSIRPYTDEEAEDAQMIENVQRTNLSPLEEARFYDALMKRRALPLGEVAVKVSKPRRYVENRLSLLTLTDTAQEHLRTGLLPERQAQVLAKLSEADQGKALKFLIQQAPEFDGDVQWAQRPTFAYCRSPHELNSFLNREVLHRLADAPFPTDAPVPGVPAAEVVSLTCTTCPQRTAANADLFGNIMPDDRCLNSGCWKCKTFGFWANIAQQAEKKYGQPVPFVGVGNYFPSAPRSLKNEAQLFGPGVVRWLDPGATFCESAKPLLRVRGSEQVQVVTACTDAACECRQRLRPDELPGASKEFREYYPADVLPRVRDAYAARRTEEYASNIAGTHLAFTKQPFGADAVGYPALAAELAEAYTPANYEVLAGILARYDLHLTDEAGRALTGHEGNLNLWNGRGRQLYGKLHGSPADLCQRVAWAMLMGLVSYRAAHDPTDTRLRDLSAATFTQAEVDEMHAEASGTAAAEADRLLRDTTVFEPAEDGGRHVQQQLVRRYGFGTPAEWAAAAPADDVLPEPAGYAEH